MDYTAITQDGRGVILTGLKNFQLDTILDCGQSFRWEKNSPESYTGVVFGRQLTISQHQDTLVFHHTTLEDFHNLWHSYFDFPQDYFQLQERFCQDPTLSKAIAFCPGMRLLRQPPWETLCSFIISQNNNIPRIKGIVSRLCETFGNTLAPGVYEFPSPETIATLALEDLAPIRAGFRAKYLLDAARRVADGRLDLASLYTVDLDQARQQLQTILGVGPKVAECVLLYGFSRWECFPVDVWIRRVLDRYYPNGFPHTLAPWAGIAQQYLFHYIRHLPPQDGAGATQ